jgi:hypothetical protein
MVQRSTAGAALCKSGGCQALLISIVHAVNTFGWIPLQSLGRSAPLPLTGSVHGLLSIA